SCRPDLRSRAWLDTGELWNRSPGLNRGRGEAGLPRSRELTRALPSQQLLRGAVQPQGAFHHDAIAGRQARCDLDAAAHVLADRHAAALVGEVVFLYVDDRFLAVLEEDRVGREGQ